MITSSSAEVRAIAVAAEAHPITVTRRIQGKPVRGLSAQRVDRALRDAGWSPLMAGTEIVGWEKA